MAFQRSIRLFYVVVHPFFLLSGLRANTGFSNVFVGYPVWIVTTLSCLFTPSHKRRDLFPLLGSISTATAVPTVAREISQRPPLFKLYQYTFVSRNHGSPLNP